jgi:putative membrane protein
LPLWLNKESILKTSGDKEKKVPGTFLDALLRALKGALIGTGFILPGVSGGALAAVFGLYERIIAFLSHPFRHFTRDVVFFIPVVIGALVGMVLLSVPLSYVLERYEAFALMFFVGAILGTFPALWREAGVQGRRPYHFGIGIAALAATLFLLALAESTNTAALPQNILTWALAGALIALGVLVPGMSPSNFLVFFGLYKPMVDAFKTFDLSVLLPIGVGALLCLLLFSKLMEWLLSKAYAGIFHAILGMVAASTVMIIPFNYNYLQPAALICIPCLAAGAALGWWMSSLEKSTLEGSAPAGGTQS